MTRDWKTGEPTKNAHYCWEDLILKDGFGITQEDWSTVVKQTAEHVRSLPEQDITGRVSCIINLLLPPLSTLWKGKRDQLPFRWLPCRSLPGATVADHALTASAIAFCLGYDNGFRSEIKTLNQLRLSALTAILRLMCYYRVEPKRATEEQRAPRSTPKSQPTQIPKPPPQPEKPRFKVGDRVNATILKKDGMKVMVQLQTSYTEEVVFERPYYPGLVGAQAKLRVQAVNESGQVTQVIP